MKKLMAILCALLALAGFLAGCGSNNDDDTRESFYSANVSIDFLPGRINEAEVKIPGLGFSDETTDDSIITRFDTRGFRLPAGVPVSIYVSYDDVAAGPLVTENGVSSYVAAASVAYLPVEGKDFPIDASKWSGPILVDGEWMRGVTVVYENENGIGEVTFSTAGNPPPPPPVDPPVNPGISGPYSIIVNASGNSLAFEPWQIGFYKSDVKKDWDAIPLNANRDAILDTIYGLADGESAIITFQVKLEGVYLAEGDGTARTSWYPYFIFYIKAGDTLYEIDESKLGPTSIFAVNNGKNLGVKVTRVGQGFVFSVPTY